MDDLGVLNLVKKRKQHYVWEHHLRGWAVDGKVWCRRGDACFQASTENVAHRNDFYRLKELSISDIEFVERLISRMGEVAQESARSWIPYFVLFHQLRAASAANGDQDPKIEKMLDAAINNLEEELHATIENNAVSILEALRRGDAGPLEDKEVFADFAWFIATQLMRTPGVQKRSVESAAGLGFNIEAAWGLLRTIFSANIGGGIFVGRLSRRLTFLESPSDIEFVTGDQPVVSTRRGGSEPLADFELYYPLSPGRALLMSFGHEKVTVERRPLSVDETAARNQTIFEASGGQVYARTKAALRWESLGN